MVQYKWMEAKVTDALSVLNNRDVIDAVGIMV